jgi:hypothetical protein
MTTKDRKPTRETAMHRLLTEPTISVYDAMQILRAGEPTVRNAIKTGALPSITLGGRNIRIPSAHVRRMLGIEAALEPTSA